jgi:putative DNA primase/helicase
MQSNEAFALWWVNTFGWYIFPVNGITDDLQCMCGNIDCKHKGKHPYTPLAPNGHNSASNDPNQIAQWWRVAPNANIGVDCGRSGLIVLDCDGAEGTTDLFNWCAGFGLEELPLTLHTRTGGGGEQFFYDAGDHFLKSMNGYQPNNDVKAQGGYVVLPSSLHASGRRYEIIGDVMFPTLIPELLATKLSYSKSGGAYESTRAPGSPSYIFSEARKFGAKSGYRDEFFNALAYALKKEGLGPQEAFDEVKRVHALTEQPPGDEFTIQEAIQKLHRVYTDEKIVADVTPEWPAVLNPDSSGQSNTSQVSETPKSIDLLEIMGSHPLTDRGNGQLLAAYVNGRWLWADKDWYEWTGGMWTIDKRRQIFEEARGVLNLLQEWAVGKTGTAGPEKRESLFKWANTSSSHGKMTSMVDLAGTHSNVARLVTEFDTNLWILTALNCTIDLRTGQGREFRQEDMCTKRTSVIYESGYQDATWTAYLQCVFNGDQDVIRYMQRVVGSMLSGEVRDKSLYMAVGPKNTGKTTFTNMLQTILGDYSMFMQPENLMYKKMSSIASHEIARMYGRRLIVSDEPAAGARFNESLLKQMTGHDTLAGDLKYRDTIEFQPTFSFFIAGNQATNVRDEALKARIIEIPFVRELQPGEQNPSVVVDAQDPNSNFCRAALAWAVEGCTLWAREGIGERPLAIQFATDDYRSDQDILGQMIDELLVVAPDEVVDMRNVYRAAQRWWSDRGEEAWRFRTFEANLKSRSGINITKADASSELHGYKINEDILSWPNMGV